MAGLLSFSRREAVGLPLTAQTVAEVVARSRRAILAQLALSVALVAGLVWIADHGSGWVRGAGYAAATLAMWGILAALLSGWDHLRVSLLLRRRTDWAIAQQSDPKKFWWQYRGVFPLTWIGNR